MLRSVHITHPAYLEYCRGLLGAMVCIKPPQGAQVGAGGGGGNLEQVRETKKRFNFAVSFLHADGGGMWDAIRFA